MGIPPEAGSEPPVTSAGGQCRARCRRDVQLRLADGPGRAVPRSFVADSVPDDVYGRPQYNANSLESANLDFGESDAPFCFRWCDRASASGYYTTGRSGPPVPLPIKGKAVGYRERSDDSTMTFVLAPGSPDSLTIRVRRSPHGPWVGRWCVRSCLSGEGGKAIVVRLVG